MNIAMMKILSLALILTLTACAEVSKVEAQAEVTPDGKVDGTLIINGNSIALKYLYTGTKKFAPSERRGRIEILITNEPISYQLLSKIFLELNVSVTNRKSKVLLSSSLKALYFTVNQSPQDINNNSGKLSCDGMLMTSESLFTFNKYALFEAASFKGSVLSAKASEKWELIGEGENYQNIKIEAGYTLSFEAKVRDESLLTRSLSSENKALQATLANIPEQGTAQGQLTVSGTAVKLNYSYAMRQKKENLDTVMIDLLKERPDEIITVLLTDKPIPKEYLAFSIDRSVPGGIHGLYLYINNTGGIRWSIIRYPSGRSGIAEEKAIKGFRLEKGLIRGSVDNKDRLDSYSVSFEAPLKE